MPTSPPEGEKRFTTLAVVGNVVNWTFLVCSCGLTGKFVMVPSLLTV